MQLPPAVGSSGWFSWPFELIAGCTLSQHAGGVTSQDTHSLLTNLTAAKAGQPTKFTWVSPSRLRGRPASLPRLWTQAAVLPDLANCPDLTPALFIKPAVRQQPTETDAMATHVDSVIYLTKQSALSTEVLPAKQPLRPVATED